MGAYNKDSNSNNIHLFYIYLLFIAGGDSYAVTTPRKNVCALIKDDEVEKPNDISGVVYVPYDARGGWRTDLAKELKTAGYVIDFNLFL
ncbi:hypothetical protein BK126_26590 [Paenibacillus sp. FSL H7-0326]|uniref:hypothetical protein n=1 Tax=Paenibacillus sp. FSL H7-0326 TaxID=1921144 RepID=UPI000979C85B|nr:hypothetical protein [Paenibacillus sp. FSL H7-0326]OMC63764.1 hypothetical protein BK126_26590 [Paenibacillus sp. FSL H7-0326]